MPKLDTVAVLLGLFLVVSVMQYFKISPDQAILAAIFVALQVKPDAK